MEKHVRKILACVLALLLAFLTTPMQEIAAMALDEPGAAEESAIPDSFEEPSEEPAEEPAGELAVEPSEGPAEEPAVEPSKEPAEGVTEEWVSVRFVSEATLLNVTVYPLPSGDDPEPEAIEPEEDGSWLLLPGEYCYSAEAADRLPVEKQPFTVEAEAFSLEIPVLFPVLPAQESAGPEADEKEQDAPAEGESEDPVFAEDEALTQAQDADGRSILKSGSCGTGVSYVLYADGELLISGFGEMSVSNMWSSNPPWPWNAYKSSIMSLRVEDGVTRLGDGAFSGCSTLKTAGPAGETMIYSMAGRITSRTMRSEAAAV